MKYTPNSYNKYYEKALKYGYVPISDISGHIGYHTNENGHYDPKDGSAPILADMLEDEGAEHHYDQTTLDHLRQHEGPFQATAMYNPKGDSKKYHIRAVRPVYGNVAYLSQPEAAEFSYYIENPTKENLEHITNEIQSSGAFNDNPVYNSERTAGGHETVHKIGNYILSHSPRFGYIGLEDVKYVPIDEHEEIKKETEKRLGN